MDENKVIFSNEYNDDGLKEGVNKTITHLQKMRLEIEDLKAETSDYNKELKANQKVIENLEKEILKYSDNLAEQNALIEKSTPIINRLTQRNYELAKSISKNKLEQVEMQKVLRETDRHHQLMERSLGKFGSASHLVAEEVSKLNRRVGTFAVDLAVGFGGALLGVALPTLAKFAEGLIEAAMETDHLSENQKLLNGIFEEAGKKAADQIVKLEAYKTKLNDLNIPAADRIRIAKEYNKVADETNKIDLKQIDNLELINKQIEKQNGLILARAVSTAALSRLTDTASKFVDAQLKVTEAERNLEAFKKFADFRATLPKDKEAPPDPNKPLVDNINKGLPNLQKAVRDSKQLRKDVVISERELEDLRRSRDEAKSLLESQTSNLSQLITVDGLTTKEGPPKKDKKGPENVYLQKLLELKAKLAKVTEQVFESEGLIKEQFSKSLDKEFGDIDKLIKDKKLTKPQGGILKGLLTDINSVELSKSLEEYRKRRREAEEKISDEIQGIQLDLSTKRIAAIRNDFERETAAIDQALTTTLDNLKKKQRDMIQDIQDNKLLTAEQKQNAITVLDLLFGELATEAGAKSVRDKAQVAFNAFEQLVQDITALFDKELLASNQNLTKRIVEAAQQYMKGAISYEEFEKRKTKIVREETHKRNLIMIEEAKVRIQALQDEFDALPDDDPNKKKVGTAITSAKNALAGLERADAEGQAGDKNKDADEKIKKIVDYTRAIGSLANEIIGFWAKVNEAEQRQIERSIALQEKRVTAAQRIAERGNAEYLRQEEDRLTQLQIKQENAAKKQLAINAVLTASQALVAFVSALAKGAEIGGPLGAIASAAAVVGLLATGFSIVKSLQDQAPKLFKGSKNVKRNNGEPAGKDTIMAMINEGEAVIPTDTNKEYHPTVEAVFDKKVPATVLNAFVKAYPNYNIPTVAYNRIGESAEFKVNSDGKLVGLLAEQIKESRETREIMESVDHSLKHLALHVGMDKDGIVASITTAIHRKKISDKA